VTRRVLLACVASVVAAAIFAPDALAHGLVGREDLPIPRWLFGWAATAVLVISFVALAVLWPEARLEKARERHVWTAPRALEVLCGVIGVALFGLAVWAGLAGAQSTQANITPTLVYVIFWNVIPVLSLVIGDWFSAFNPWRAIARGASWVAGRVSPGSVPDVLPYPERLGYWPAALGIFGFAALELVVRPSIGEDPSWLAILSLVYAAVMLVGMALYGVEAWTRNADGFAVLFRLFSTLAPLHWSERRLAVRAPLTGTVRVAPAAGLVAVVAVAIGTTSFDGMRENKWWTDIALDIQGVLQDIGLSPTFGLEVAYCLGMLAVVVILGSLYLVGVLGMRTVDKTYPWRDLARRFAPSLIPIALAYMVAHYWSQIAARGQATVFLASDPLGKGWDLFGTADNTINYAIITANRVWYVQVGALILGHVAGLILAHDRALAIFKDPRVATRSQYWMLAVMVAFTSLGLWLLSSTN
jgi:hypothetical protein